MQHRWSKPIRYSLIVAVMLFCGVTLSGCDVLNFLGDIFRVSGGNEARAQNDQFVRTFTIQPGTFRIEPDRVLIINENVTITDGVTVYRDLTGTVRYREVGSTVDSNFELVQTDIVIERPGSNMLTLITSMNTFP